MKKYQFLKIYLLFVLIQVVLSSPNHKHFRQKISKINSKQQKEQQQLLETEYPNKIENDLNDYSSVSNFDLYTTKHFHLNLKVDTDKQKIEGSQTLTMENLDIDQNKTIILDVFKIKIHSVHFLIQNSHNFIKINKKHHNQKQNQQKIPLNFKYTDNLDGAISEYGEKLEIFLDNDELIPYYNFEEIGQEFKIKIKFETTKEQTAISYLTKEQTESKKLNYIFSQCESVACRSLAPFQDTPSVKSTYSADVTIPKEYNVFMSANQISEVEINENLKKIGFALDIVIPSYLVAIVVGYIEEVQISDRVYLITEPQNIEFYSQVLEDTETYLQYLENYLSPYKWGVYKVVALPYSFPYAGMENPLLTFISPNIITHDKSQMSVIVHEIAHSWFGNTVTCNNWENLWLNEGLTNFVEFKIQGQLDGQEFYKFQNELAANELENLIDNFVSSGLQNLTSLKPDLKNHHPDDYCTSVPYDKGALFMAFLEKTVGEEEFKLFLQDYLKKFDSKSITPQDFKNSFLDFFKDFDQDQLNNIDWDTWIYSTGQIPVKLDYSNDLSKNARKFAQKYVENNDSIDINDYKNFHYLQKRLFLNTYSELMYDNFTEENIDTFQQKFEILETENTSILSKWLLVLIKNRKKLSDQELQIIDQFISTKGLGGYANNIYKSLLENGYEDIAKEKFQEYKQLYHIVNQVNIQKIFDNYEEKEENQNNQLFLIKSKSKKFHHFIENY